eukprot:scaffold10834_cov129-Isochrysis_galbana.AAC.1
MSALCQHDIGDRLPPVVVEAVEAHERVQHGLRDRRARRSAKRGSAGRATAPARQPKTEIGLQQNNTAV